MKILVMGLPGSGKTTFAREIAYHFNLPQYNADTIREYYDDWDFSFVGRLKQASRMSSYQFGVLDFVCPSRDFRKLVNADYTIWLDTIQKSVHRDTNIVFEKQLEYTQHYICCSNSQNSKNVQIVDKMRESRKVPFFRRV